MNYNVYLLKNTNNNRTYLGITNNLERRLRQHNNEIKGGAKYTHNFKGNGMWYYYRYICNLTKNESYPPKFVLSTKLPLEYPVI